MSTYLSDKLRKALGGTEVFASDRSKEWSPNLYKYLIIFDESIMAIEHTGKANSVPIALEDAQEDVGSILEVFRERAFGTLEGIFLSSQLVVPPEVTSGILQEFENRRLFQFGEVAPGVTEVTESWKGFQVIDLTEVSQGVPPGYNGKAWYRKYRLLPETYGPDASLKGYFEGIEDQEVEAAAAASGEEAVADESSDGSSASAEDRTKVVKYFAPMIKGVVSNIVEEHTKIFASGYEVISPFGVLSTHEGIGSALRLSGSRLEVGDPDRVLQNLYSSINGAMSLTICPVRNIKQIANVITTGYISKAAQEGGGEKYEGNLYFPNKMLEYAFGRQKATAGEGGVSNYPPHDSSSSWGAYSKTVVQASLHEVLSEVVIRTIENNGLLENYFHDEADELISASLEKIRRAMCTVVLVSKLDKLRDNPSVLKVRVLDPDKVLPRDRNLSTEVIIKSLKHDGGVKANSAPIVDDGIFVEYTHEVDHHLANAEPLFAFKALEALKRQGDRPSWETLILGVDTSDKIMKAGGDGVDLTANLAHGVVAGSRAGKGVMTLNFLASAVASKKPILYSDNKPDMASLLAFINPTAYVVNGADYTHSKADGTDYFGMFAARDSWVNPEAIPGYLSEMFSSKKYDDLAAIVYSRSVLLSMSILAARVKCQQWYSELGGPTGIVVVIDELTNASNQFNTFFAKNRQKHLANTSYAPGTAAYNKSISEYEETLEAWESGGKQGARPAKPSAPTATKPTPTDYWFTCVYEAMEESVETLYELANAGLKNSEAKVSDVFILSQTIFNPISSLAEKSELFVKRNKDSTGAAAAPKRVDLLPSLVMVGGVDAFLGYNKDLGGILNQGNPKGIAHDKLDPNARNFAYVANFMGDGRVSAANGDEGFARKAKYFKPFLIFSDGDQNEYFVKNMLSYAEKSGIDPKDIISRNEDPKNEGQLNPAVGFLAYLDEMGINKDQASEVLQSGADIAQFVVTKMGYPGTWKEFLLDLRPEWTFSVTDVINSLNGTPLAGNVTRKLADFVSVYPEMFPNHSLREDEGFGSGTFISDEDDSAVVGGSGDDEDGVSWGSDDEDSSFGSPPPQPAYGTPPPATPAPDYGFDDGFNPGGSLGGTEVLPGVLDSWEPEQEAVPVSPVHDAYDAESGPQDIISVVTEAVLAKVGVGRIERIAVLGGALVVNSTPVSLRLPAAFLASTPQKVRNELRGHLLARYFNWGILEEMPNLASLRFDDRQMVHEVVIPEMGFASTGRHGVANDGIQEFFEVLDRLTRLQIGTRRVTRGNHLDSIPEDTRSVADRRSFAMGSAVDSMFTSATRGSFLFTRNVISNRDLHMSARVLGGVAGVGATALSGAAVVTTKVTRGVVGGITSAFRSVRKAMRDGQ